MIINDVHVWINTQGKTLVSHEDVKSLFAYNTLNEAVNDLFNRGYTEEARTLNSRKNEVK